MSELGEEISLRVVVEFLILQQFGHGGKDLGGLVHGHELAAVVPQRGVGECLVKIYGNSSTVPLKTECYINIFQLFFMIFSFDTMPLNREGAVDVILNSLHDRDVVIGTTGMLSRELFELRENRGQGHEKDFLTVGSMGHASAIALGVSLNRPRRQVC